VLSTYLQSIGEKFFAILSWSAMGENHESKERSSQTMTEEWTFYTLYSWLLVAVECYRAVGLCRKLISWNLASKW